MRVEFINSKGGTMFVDESRIEEYKAAGHILAADVIDTKFVDDEKPKTRRKKKEV